MSHSRIHKITAWALFLIVISAYMIMAVKFPLAFIKATYEDLIGEWMQVFFFVTVLIFSLRLALASSRFRIFFAVLALASFYAAGEEISWGQRLIGLSSPEVFQKYNLQKETNLHNFLTGPFNTAMKRSLEYILFTGLTVYGLVFPLALRFRWSPAQWIESRGFPAPPLYLWPFFVISGILELGLLKFNEAEIAEILIPIGLSIVAEHYWVEHRTKSSPDMDLQASRRLALIILIASVSVVTSAALVTRLEYGSPRLKALIESRLLNGIEKFANRYKDYERWEAAAQLFHEVDRRDPGRPSIMRDLARCYKGMGDTERSGEYISAALEIDMKKYRNHPEKISANLSLARTYRQIDEDNKASFHLGAALQSAQKRVVADPESASAHYWLGQTYVVAKDYPAALSQFKKAYELKPLSARYKKAYMKARGLAEESDEEQADSKEE